MAVKSKGRVFVVQRQMVWSDQADTYVPKFDMSTAEIYGELVTLLNPKASEKNPLAVVAELHKKLANYNCDDYLLLVGNPALIGWTTAIAAQKNGGIVRQLIWSGRDKRYNPVWVDLTFSI